MKKNIKEEYKIKKEEKEKLKRMKKEVSKEYG